jgi:PAS domain S-box-containing protein
MTFARRVGIGAGLAAVVPLVFAGLIFVNQRAGVRQTREIVEPAQRALMLTAYLERLVIDMETGIRGFRVVGEEAYLEPYTRAVSLYRPAIEEIQSRITAEKERRLLADIRGRIEEYRSAWAEPRIAYLRQHPAQPQEGGIVLPRVPAALTTAEGKRRVDELRRRFGDLERTENGRLADSLRSRDREQERLSILLWTAAAILCFLFLLGSAWLFRSYRRRAALLFAGLGAAGRGEYRPVLLSGEDEPGKIAAAFNRMVSEIEGRDEALRKTADELADLYDHAPCGFHTLAPDGTFFRVNETLLQWSGYSREDLLARRRFSELLTPASRKQFEASLPHLQREGVLQDLELELVRKDGTVLPVLLNGAVVRDVNGRFLRSRFTTFDIAERKRAQEELDRFFRLSVDMLAVAGFDGCFKRLNPIWERVLGWSQEELLARPFLDFVHPEDRESTAAEAAKLARGAETISFTNRYLCADGSYRWLLWNASPDVERQRIYAAARDVTEKKHFDEEIEKLNSELEKRVAELASVNQELEAFSYSVSHDLRSPLRHIDGFTRLLVRHTVSSLDEKGRHYLDTIADSVHQMGDLIEDLLAFSRLGRAEIRTAPVDLAALARDAIAEVEQDINGREVRWTVGTLPMVTGDAALLRQTFINLLSNALKYTRPREIACIEMGSAGGKRDEVVCFVRDNGVGFDMKYVDKLFGVFQRLHGPEEFEGTGIGLANVRRVIQRHGGRVWAEGEVDGGATFYFTLPRGAAETT